MPIRSEEIIRTMLLRIGEDPTREGLIETPTRVRRSWGELYAGYRQCPSKILKTFECKEATGLVYLKNIEFYSMCEHHMLPFTGQASIAYIPHKRVIGVSKLARILDIYARRLQIQERIAEQVTEALMEHLRPKGAACILEAKHLCMACRGVQKQHSIMGYQSLKGVFLTDQAARAELMTTLLR